MPKAKKILLLLAALATLPAGEAAAAAAAAAPAPLVKRGSPAPVPAVRPPSPVTLYDRSRADPMKPPALPTPVQSLPGLPPPGIPGLDPYAHPTPEQDALMRAKGEGKYLGTMGSERVWRYNGTLYFEKIERKKD